MLKFTKRRSMASEDPRPSSNSQFFVPAPEDGECQVKQQVADSGKSETSNKASSENAVDESLHVEASEDPRPSSNSQFFVPAPEDGECQVKQQVADSGKSETSNKASSENAVDESLHVEVSTNSMTATFTKNAEENPADGGENLDAECICEDLQPQRQSVFEPQSDRPQGTTMDREKLMGRIRHLRTVQAGAEDDLQVTAVLSSMDSPLSPMPSSTESGSAEGNFLSDYWKGVRWLFELSLSKSRSGWLAFKTYAMACRSLERLTEGAIGYTLCFIACLVSLVVGINIEQYRDIPFCVLGVIMSCCLVTLTLERGFYTRWIDRRVIGRNSLDEEIYDYSCSSWQWLLCCNQDDQQEDRSQHVRPRKVPSTDFICEVSDVADIEAGECPQVKDVEPEGVTNSSFDQSSPGPIRTVRVDVHRPESDDERPTLGCQLGCEGACACPGLNAELDLDSTSAVVPVCPRCGQIIPCACRRRRKVTAC